MILVLHMGLTFDKLSMFLCLKKFNINYTIITIIKFLLESTRFL